MYQYEWDKDTGGILLIAEQSKFSKEPRPVYYKEMDILGFDQYWNYPKNEKYPIMWAEANNYIYKGRTIAKTKGGTWYTKPELIILDNSDSELEFVDIDKMIFKNQNIIENLAQETIQKVYNIYRQYKKKVDIFYVAFSGGKDSVVALDIVQRALPHNDFVVLFGDTRMEFCDTYKVVEKEQEICRNLGIEFFVARSKLVPEQTWKCFGPPSTSNRWCCSVHKTSPQIILLRELTDNYNFTGMAFTGVRAEESLTRSEYEPVSEGEKHNGQYSCHTILNWNSAELFLYIYSKGLVLNEAYKKGNSRAGCLVCPNSSGRHEYIKRYNYQDEVDSYLEIIGNTSGKTNYSDLDMKNFIDAGFWRTRKTGRELNFGQDRFELRSGTDCPTIDVHANNFEWKQWGKTIGNLTAISDTKYNIEFNGKFYLIEVQINNDKTIFKLLNCDKSKQDTRFSALFRSVIIKSLYCIGCGACEAECKYKCIDMKNGISISDNCRHCHKCHDIHEHCLRYQSVRNKISEGRKMEGLDRYFSFGIREQWLETYIKYEGKSDFWISDGDGQVANKKKDAFKNFASDAGIILYDKTAEGDKYTKCLPTDFGKTICKLGSYDCNTWALILCNLVYTSAYNWFVNNLKIDTSYSAEAIRDMLGMAMENDTKGLGRRNVIDALKIVLHETPFGKERIFADYDIDEKINKKGETTLTLNSVRRCKYDGVTPEVVLYSLYKFAEACGDYYQFTLDTLLDDTIERDGVSPTKIFGLDKDDMVRILNGLSINYPEYISASFTLDLDNITLRPDKTSKNILDLF